MCANNTTYTFTIGGRFFSGLGDAKSCYVEDRYKSDFFYSRRDFEN